MKITKRNRQTITNSCQVSECDKLKDDENISIQSACDVNSGSELDYMLNDSDQYAVEQALDMLRSGDEDDIETVVRYAVNVVNNGNAEPEYEDEDFYQEEADYDTVLRAVKEKLGRGIKSSCDVTLSSDKDYEALTDNVGLYKHNSNIVDWMLYEYPGEYERMMSDLESNGLVRSGDPFNSADAIYILDWIYQHDNLWLKFKDSFPSFAREYIEDELGEKWDKYVESSENINCDIDINRADYLYDLCEAIDSYIDEQGYSSVVSVTDGYYITVQLFDFNEEDFETEDSLHTAVFDIDELDENEDIYNIAEQLGQSVIDEYESIDFSDDRYEEKETKQVVDSDGFMTDYTMYYDRNDDKYIFMLGDKDAYGPDDNYADWECDSEQEAYEWFESYEGFEDKEEY